jgi:hypothetical protein
LRRTNMKFKIALPLLLTTILLIPTPSQGQTTVSFGGYCDTTSNPGQLFVLHGLGQNSATACTYGPGNPTVLIGQLVSQNGTLTNLVVKQQQLNGAPMGGTVTVWVNPKTSGAVIQTSISCSPSFFSSGLYKCSSSNTYSVVAGDRIIVIGTPPPGTSISPVEATVDLATTSTAVQPFAGYCGSVSNTGLQFVLNGLGQNSNTNCVYGPGSPVSAFLGTVLPRTGTLKNLYVKQEQLNFAPMGGSVSVWVNQKSGGSPVQTAIACALASSGSLYLCNDTSHTFSVTTGDKVIVIVSPPGGQSISPVTATVDVQ